MKKKLVVGCMRVYVCVCGMMVMVVVLVWREEENASLYRFLSLHVRSFLILYYDALFPCRTLSTTFSLPISHSSPPGSSRDEDEGGGGEDVDIATFPTTTTSPTFLPAPLLLLRRLDFLRSCLLVPVELRDSPILQRSRSTGGWFQTFSPDRHKVPFAHITHRLASQQTNLSRMRQ